MSSELCRYIRSRNDVFLIVILDLKQHVTAAHFSVRGNNGEIFNVNAPQKLLNGIGYVLAVYGKH